MRARLHTRSRRLASAVHRAAVPSASRCFSEQVPMHGSCVPTTECSSAGGWGGAGRSSTRRSRADPVAPREMRQSGKFGRYTTVRQILPPTAPCAACRARQATVPASAGSETHGICSSASPRALSVSLLPSTRSQTLINPSPSLPPACRPQAAPHGPENRHISTKPPLLEVRFDLP